MNHAGEISTLVRRRRAGRARLDQRGRGAPRLLCVGRRDRRREGRDSSKAPRRRRCSSPTPMTTRIATRTAALRRPRGDVRHRSRRRRARDRRRRSRHRRHRARASRPPRGDVDADDAAGRPRQPGERAGGHGRGARVRRAARRRLPSARATLRPAAHRGEVVRLGRRRHASSTTATTRTRRRRGARSTCWPAQRRRAAHRGARRDAGARRSRVGAARGRRPRGAPPRAVDVLFAVGGAPARALADAAVAAGMPAAHVRHFATSDEAADAAAAIVRPGDLVLVKGSRGMRTDRVVDRLKAELAR